MFRWFRSGVFVAWIALLVAGALLVVVAIAVGDPPVDNTDTVDVRSSIDQLQQTRIDLQHLIGVSGDLAVAAPTAQQAAQHARDAAAVTSGRAAQGFTTIADLLDAAAAAAGESDRDTYLTDIAAAAAQSDQLILLIGARTGEAGQQPSTAMASAPLSHAADRAKATADNLGWPTLEVTEPDLRERYETLLEQFLTPQLPALTAADITETT